MSCGPPLGAFIRQPLCVAAFAHQAGVRRSYAILNSLGPCWTKPFGLSDQGRSVSPGPRGMTDRRAGMKRVKAGRAG
jgi:hypothetical protein